MKIYLRTVVSAHENPLLVRRFVEHYRFFGVDEFLVCINEKEGCDDSVERVFLDQGIAVTRKWKGPYSEYVRLDIQNELVSALNDQDWVVNADIDEFHRFPSDLNDIINLCEYKGFEWARGGLIDRFTKDGVIPILQEDVSLFEQFPVEGCIHQLKPGSKLRTRVTGFSGKIFQPKIVFNKKKHETGNGNHFIGSFRKPKKLFKRGYPYRIPVDHFKWHGDVLNNVINIQSDDLNADVPDVSGKDFIINHINENCGIDISKVAIEKKH